MFVDENLNFPVELQSEIANPRWLLWWWWAIGLKEMKESERVIENESESREKEKWEMIFGEAFFIK